MKKYYTLAIAASISAMSINANAQTWQRVTPGGGGGSGASYTAWGTTSCASGYSVAYSGTAIFPISRYGSTAPIGQSIGTTICSEDSLNQNIKLFHGSLGWSSGSGAIVSNNDIDNTASISCAVCVK